MQKSIIYILITIMGSLPVTATVVSQESFAKQIRFQGQKNNPIVISPPAKLKLSPNTEKLVVIPEKLDIKDEIHEFRMFRNRYVIFGVYLSLALYYNWLTRHR